jgi:hypothetical protein
MGRRTSSASSKLRPKLYRWCPRPASSQSADVWTAAFNLTFELGGELALSGRVVREQSGGMYISDPEERLERRHMEAGDPAVRLPKGLALDTAFVGRVLGDMCLCRDGRARASAEKVAMALRLQMQGATPARKARKAKPA